MNTRKMGAYWSLAVQTVISGVIMYLVMFVMIDGLDSFYNNLNMLYMGASHKTGTDIRSHDCHPRRWPSLLLRWPRDQRSH